MIFRFQLKKLLSNTLFFTMLSSLLCLTSCRRNTSNQQSFSLNDSSRIIKEIMVHRAEMDSFFRFHPESPFQKDPAAHFTGIRWFPPDPKFSLQSKLHRYEHPETVGVFGTKGDERTYLKYGYFLLDLEGNSLRLNAYKTLPGRSKDHLGPLSIWFTDATTGKETYNVGRYVDVGDEQSDSDSPYTINFNNAYNPYCAYSDIYSCAIPRKEDRLDIPIRAGEMKYHP